VCERGGDRLEWFLDTVTRNALAGIVDAPAGFAEEAEFFTHYDYFRQGGLHVWQRQRRSLTVDAVLDLLGDLLEAS
jgi:hypothetical protein